MGTDYSPSKHDIGLLRQDGTTKIGLMLAKDKSGKPIYQVYDDEYLANQQFTGDADYGALPAEKDMVLIEDDWRRGISQDVYDPADDKHYFYSTNMDMRFKGMALCGPVATAITRVTLADASITDPDLEVWTGNSLDNWTYTVDNGASTLTDETTTVHHGAHSAKVVQAAAGNSGHFHQSLSWSTTYQSKRYIFTVWCHANTASRCRIAIYDGVSRTYSDYHTGGSSWEKLIVTMVLASNASELTLEMWNENGAITAYWDDTATSADMVCRAWAEYFNELWVSEGMMLLKLNIAGDEFEFIELFPEIITALEPFTDDNLLIGQGSTEGLLWYLDDNELDNCEVEWDEQVDTDVTHTLDSTNAQRGDYCLKFVCAAGLAAGDIIASQDISSTDMTGDKYISLLINCSVSTSAGNLKFLLDETAKVATPDKTLSIPALTADTWTSVLLELGDMSALNAVISYGIEYDADIGACTIYVDQIRRYGFTKHGSDYAYHLKTVHTAAPTMYKTVLPNALESATDPTGAFGGATTVDSSSYNITGLLSFDGALHIMKEDRPFYLDSSGNVQVLTNITRALRTATSGKNALDWQDKVYMPWGESSLLEYDSGDLTWLSPASFCVNLGDFDDEVMALAADDEWLFAAVDNSASIEIMTGRHETVGSTTAWTWHPLHKLTLAGCETMFVSSVYQKRLWITPTSSSDSMYYIPLPTSYGDITNDANRSFLTDGYFETPWHHFNFKGDDNQWVKVVAWLGHDYDADIYFECHYKKVNDSSYTDIGDFKGTATNRVATLYLPVDASSNNPVSTLMRFKLVAKTDDSTKTPILKRFEIWGTLKPPKRKLIYCEVRCVDNPLNKQGQPDAVTAAEIKEALDEANIATWPVTFYDVDYAVTSTAKYVNFLPMIEEVREIHREPHNIEKVFKLTLQEKTLS